jgi:hypothetical protein
MKIVKKIRVNDIVIVLLYVPRKGHFATWIAADSNIYECLLKVTFRTVKGIESGVFYKEKYLVWHHSATNPDTRICMRRYLAYKHFRELVKNVKQVKFERHE